MPIPLEGIPLVVDESFSFHNAYRKVDEEIQPDRPPTEVMKKYGDWKIRNQFYCGKKSANVLVIENPETGHARSLVYQKGNHMDEVLATLFASDVWGVDQEQAALKTLGGMLRHRQFKQYLLTGMFMEKSQRSHVQYVFRRLRPTLALSANRPGSDQESSVKILAALCMHPIAYYHGSWAGAMCPTDDIIAHLSLMRGDEHMFWRRANQHPAWSHLAGVGG
jgi:hypothetical protein